MILRHLPLGLVRFVFIVIGFVTIPIAGIVPSIVLDKMLGFDIGMPMVFVGVAAMGLVAWGIWMLYRRTVANLAPQPWRPVWSFVIMGGLLGVINAASLALILVPAIRGGTSIPYEELAASAGFGLAVAVAGVIALNLLHRAGLQVASWPTWIGLFILGNVQPGVILGLADRIGEADRMPIAVIYVGVVSAVFAVLIGWRLFAAGGRLVGDTIYGAARNEDRFEAGSLVLGVVVFVVVALFFHIGLSASLDWQPAEAFAVSALLGSLAVMGLVVLTDGRVGSLTVTFVAAIVLATVAAKLPPATTSVLVILAASAAVALALKLVSVVRRRRRATFVNAMAMSSAALVLLMLPAETSVASRIAALAGTAPEAASRRVTALYLTAYGTKAGRAAINLFEGFRPDRAAVRVAGVTEAPAGHGFDVVLDVRNTGEAAIRSFTVYLTRADTGLASDVLEACGHVAPTGVLASPLLPGDTIRVTLTWTAKVGCSDEDRAAVRAVIAPDLEAGAVVRDVAVTGTAAFDRKAVFRSEARAWLGL